MKAVYVIFYCGFYKGNYKLAEISDCGDKGDVELLCLVQTITDEMEDNQ